MEVVGEGVAEKRLDHDAYEAATRDVAIADRNGRAWLSATGRDPVGMLGGILTGRIPPPLTAARDRVARGRAEGSAVLTPKGRMVSELRVLRMGTGPEDGVLLEMARAGLEGTRQHLAKYVPPRLATIGDASESVAMLTVLGPGAADVLAREVLEGLADAEELIAQREGDLVRVDGSAGAVTVMRTGEVAAPAWDVVATPSVIAAVRSELVSTGTVEVGPDVVETLRVEAGRPLFGVDMDESTIPVEAGIHTRVIDYTKGCFTGQEVIIRIRDRGHVNRHLRGVRLGDVPPPEAGDLLYAVGSGKEVGAVTSAVRSPQFGETIALGYVRREVVPPASVAVGAPDGPAASVHDLESDWGPTRA